MLKVSFKDDCMKVQTFNNKATVVTIVGKMIMPRELWATFPNEVANWMWEHPSIDASWGDCTKEYDIVRLEFSGKAVCSNEDTFNEEIGKRIAESRAKIKLYKFMHNLIKGLCSYYVKLLLGYSNFQSASNINNSLYSELSKYKELLIKESHHLDELLEEA